MGQNYRNQSGRPDEPRGGRYQTGSERDRYGTGGEQRFNPDWEDRSRGFEGDRSYSAGGYSEEFGYQGGRGRDDERDFGGRSESGHDPSDYQGARRYAGGQRGRENQSRFGSRERWNQPSGGRYDNDADFYARDREPTGTWREDERDSGGYFGTGSYVDEDSGSRGLHRDFYRARSQQERDFGSFRDRDNAGDYGNYGRSTYGSQSNYARGQSGTFGERPWRSQQSRSGYEGRSSSDYGAQRGGSGSSSGAFGRDFPGAGQNYGQGYGSSAPSQSFRGKGPQGYQRSDERLKEMICERLTDDPDIDASNVTIDVTGQVVKLTGTVDDRSTKYEIEELVERMGGVKDIDNQLRVQSSRWGSQQSTGPQGQQMRGGSDWESGSSSTTTTGRSESRSSAGTTSGASTTGSPSAGSTSKRN